MHNNDYNRVVFYSREDLSSYVHLQKSEVILRSTFNTDITDVNDILELYHINKFIDNNLYLKSWTQDDIHNFRENAGNSDKVIKDFFLKINDVNIIKIYANTLTCYINSFWEIINNLHGYNQISKVTFETILLKEPAIIHTLLKYKGIVRRFDKEIRSFLLTDINSAELILSVYEIKDRLKRPMKHLPKSLSVEDKEKIISNYLHNGNCNLNYLILIQNAKNVTEFKLSARTRLKAKRLYENDIDEFFKDNQGIKFGVSVSFPNNSTKIKEAKIGADNSFNYLYSADFIVENQNPYSLFHLFDILFEFVDEQKRIDLVSKRSKISVFESVLGVRSEYEYIGGTEFTLSEMKSQAEMYGYSRFIKVMGNSIEEILKYVFTNALQEKYNFPQNAIFSPPLATNSFLEKIRIIAPEFEAILKQYKLYVEDGIIDFELLQMSSSPSTINDIPSLNKDKYIYFNETNTVMVRCLNTLFSDQTGLCYVDPYKEKNYKSFFDLLSNEDLKYDTYEEFQKSQLHLLIDNNIITIDRTGFIKILNYERLFIFKDLYENEVGSFYHYTKQFQEEVKIMIRDGIIYTETTLFTKPEQSYFNYFLNKREFTNGLDLRNRYLHGTQANPSEIEKHEQSYHIYLKLIVLALFKIEDDLQINQLKYE